MLSIYVGIVGFIALIMAVVSFKRPGLAFVLVASMYVFEQLLQSQFAFFTSNSWFVNVSVASLALVVLVGTKGKAAFQLPLDRISFTFTLFFGLVFFSAYWSRDVDLALDHLRSALPYLIVASVLAPRCISSERDLRDACYGLLLFSLLLSVGMLFSSVDAQQKRWTVLKFGGGDEFLGNPLEVGSCGARLAVLSLIFFHNYRSTLIKSAFIGFALVGIALAIKSGSRGQVIAIPVAVVLTFVCSQKVKTIMPFVLASASAAILGYTAFLLIDNFDFGRRFALDSMQKSVYSERLEPTLFLLQEYLSSDAFVLLFGLGAESSYSIIGFYPHVQFLQVWAEQGILGIVLFFAFFWYAIRKSISFVRSPLNNTTVACHELMLGLMIFDLVLMMKQGATLGSTSYLIPMLIASQTVPSSSPTISQERSRMPIATTNLLAGRQVQH